MLFGSELFESIIGELQSATQVKVNKYQILSQTLLNILYFRFIISVPLSLSLSLSLFLFLSLSVPFYLSFFLSFSLSLSIFHSFSLFYLSFISPYMLVFFPFLLSLSLYICIYKDTSHDAPYMSLCLCLSLSSALLFFHYHVFVPLLFTHLLRIWMHSITYLPCPTLSLFLSLFFSLPLSRRLWWNQSLITVLSS